MKIDDLKRSGIKKLTPDTPRIAVGMGTCGIGNGALDLYNRFDEYIKKKQKDIVLTRTGCFGFCSQEPLVNLHLPGKPLLILKKITLEDIPAIIKAVNTGNSKTIEKYILCKITDWDHITTHICYGEGFPHFPSWDEIPFFKWQKKIVLRDCGIINPEDIEEYIAVGGYASFCKVLAEISPEKIIEELKISKLRGRGGVGFPTWKKWDIMKSQKEKIKYIICNADEGNPGEYMNRNEIEGDPHMIIEGMLIGAFAMGAREGIIYIRAEYPLAIERMKKAVSQAEKAGFLGDNIQETDFCFHIYIVIGAGSYVCGEETALIASIEGKPGNPRLRPPFPAQKGLWEKPTTVNNVETWANIPAIITRGGLWFSQIGTDKSTGTKVFSLAGKIKNRGLVELPLGETIDTIVFKTGGGHIQNKKIKAVQTGGPSGGFVPLHLFNTPVDYESLTDLGTSMGSGGMIVMDENNCMVDMAKYFVEFACSESCGRCVPCREGLQQALILLKAATRGEITEEQLKWIFELGSVMKDTTVCGHGQASLNPVISTLTYFYDEYIAHIKNRKCAAGVCEF